MLTPIDLQSRDFRKSFRGYDPHDVDEFLDRVSTEFDRLFRLNVQQRDDIESLKKRIEEYQQMESSLRDTLMLAQDASRRLKETTTKEAELIVTQAKDEARRIVDAAQDSILKKKLELEELRRYEELFRLRFKAFLESYLTTLERDASLEAAATLIPPEA